MIDYEYLCQMISDWRAGRRPTAMPGYPSEQARPMDQGGHASDEDVVSYDEIGVREDYDEVDESHFGEDEGDETVYSSPYEEEDEEDGATQIHRPDE
jgi:hypothetical protein